MLINLLVLQKNAMKNYLLILILSIISVNSNAQLPSYVPATGLVAWYPFTGNANDSSGYNNNLIPNGSPVYTIDAHGRSNSAIYLPNGNDYFSLPNASYALINNFSSGTVSFWINLDSVYVSGHYFDYNNSFMIKNTSGVGNDLFFGMQAGTTNIRFQVSGIFPSTSDLISSTSIAMNQWYNIAGTWDGITWNLYINGVLDTFQPDITIMSNRPDSGSSTIFTLGSAIYGGNGTTTYPTGTYGKLDNVGIWNRALSQCEITSLYLEAGASIVTNPVNDTVSAGSIATFSITDTGTATYQWQQNTGLGFVNLSNAGPYSGVTTKTMTINPVAATMNNYLYQCVRNGSSCIETSNSAALVIATTGIVQPKQESFSISPNPVNSVLTINANGIINKVEIFNLVGQKVFTEKYNTQNISIDISTFENGFYFIKLNDGYAQKLIKE